MPQRPAFSPNQYETLHATALRLWKRFRSDGKSQKELADALGLSQQSVSALLKGTYRPGTRAAQQIASLDGHELEELIGPYEPKPERHSEPKTRATPTGFRNLDTCLAFFSSLRHWSPWTIAAARAGFFGQQDFAPPDWSAKLDALEKTLERARKA